MIATIGKLWRGDISLWKTFWLFGVLGIVLLRVVAVVSAIYMSFGVFAGLLLLSFLYMLFIWVAIWRSAGQYKGPPVNRILARTSVVLAILILLGNIGRVLSSATAA